MGRFSTSARGAGKKFSKFSDPLVNSPERTELGGIAACRLRVVDWIARTPQRLAAAALFGWVLLPCRCQSCDARFFKFRWVVR